MNTFIDRLDLTPEEKEKVNDLKELYGDTISENMLGVVVRQQRREQKYIEKCDDIVEMEKKFSLSSCKINENLLGPLKHRAFIFDPEVTSKDGVPLLILRPLVLSSFDLSEEDEREGVFGLMHRIFNNIPEVTSKGLHVVIDIKGLPLTTGIKSGWDIYCYITKFPARPQRIAVYQPSYLLSWAIWGFKKFLSTRMQERVATYDSEEQMIEDIGIENLTSIYGGTREDTMDKIAKTIFCQGDSTLCEAYDNIIVIDSDEESEDCESEEGEGEEN